MLTASTGRQLARTAFALVVVALAACGRDSQAPLPAPAVNQVAATYLVGAVCVTCHAAEADLWRKSHHALAMQPADATTVLANFADTTFTKDGVVSTFFRRDGGYYVRTDGLRNFAWPTRSASSPCSSTSWSCRKADCRRSALRGTRGRRRRAGSAGFTCTRARRSIIGMSCIGRGRRRTGTTCARIATRPISRRTIAPGRIDSKRSGRT